MSRTGSRFSANWIHHCSSLDSFTRLEIDRAARTRLGLALKISRNSMQCADSTPTSKNDYERTFFSKGTDSKVVVKLTAPLWKMESPSQLLGHQGGEEVLPTEEKWKATGTLLFDVGPETITIFITTLQGEWKLEGYVVTLKHECKRAKKVGSR
ncbi:hypothetical protein BDN71DRAFT_1430953 [Pleurotus eryngii]|uniref:Uncharacterized protein n=1 Tax=Pleurotus eryngii TaxID=5323 RepID=A0A9P5ZXM6_PLEER|nr:hypothetical protein BDN71DRAFT_1430953 [Pleurotus eryngii]